MTELSHRDIEELLAAFCLDAVDDDERAAIEAHLPACPRCRAEVADYREVAALLANGDTPAPDGVWDRIVEAIEEEPPPLRLQLVPREIANDAEPAVAPVASRGWRSPRRIAISALSAAAAVAIVVLGWQVHDLRNHDDKIEQQLASANATRETLSEANQAMLDPSSRLARLTGTEGQHALAVLQQDGTGYFLASDLPALSSGVYELWSANANGTVSPLGSLDGPGVSRFTAGDDVTQLMVTVEPAFVNTPTNNPIAQGSVA